MRGKVRYEVREHVQAGITPAYAGKSGATTSAQTTPPDHPRVCGEKAAWFLPCRIDQGSPPRMRGKATVADVPAKSVGITPAYAGKSGFLLFAWSLLRDHPRVCGEKALCTPYGCFTPGSPPRMRGKGNPSPISHSQKRITPAYAGKSPSARFRVHIDLGSPPRMRGKVAVQSSNSHQFRITPAYAGKS